MYARECLLYLNPKFWEVSHQSKRHRGCRYQRGCTSKITRVIVGDVGMIIVLSSTPTPVKVKIKLDGLTILAERSETQCVSKGET